jgi:hypothetical protein
MNTVAGISGEAVDGEESVLASFREGVDPRV